MNEHAGSWPVIGPVGPMTDGLDQPYWDGLSRGQLLVQRCGTCARWLWGPRWVCDRCHALDPAWVEVEPVGHIYSWIRTWQPFAAEFAHRLPYCNALVELRHAGGVRMVALLVDQQDAGARDQFEIVIGAPVEAFVQPAHEATGGVPVLRWQLTEKTAEGM